MIVNTQLKEGASSLLTEGLRLRKHDRVFIVVQNELQDISHIIKTQCDTLGIISEVRLFDKEDFYKEKYPKPIDTELSRSDSLSGIILIIEWSPETTGGRLAFLRKLMNSKRLWRIASMPGMQLKYLHSCKCDYKRLDFLCHDVFESLAAFSHARITTKGPNNNTGILNLDLGKHKPIISSGIIEDGKWGNIPSGETFCMPDPINCSGTVFIRGSIPNYPLKANEWIFFHVIKGLIVPKSIEASSNNLVNIFRNLFFKQNNKPQHVNSNVLAELGIGLNENIDTLTGIPLFDEKKIGTIHLGFGSNYQFNGEIKCKTHHDLVITDVTVKLFNESETIFEDLIINNTFKKDRLIETTEIYNQCNEVRLFDGSSISFVNDDIILNNQTNRNHSVNINLGHSEAFHGVKNLVLGQTTLTSKQSPDFFESKQYYQLLLYKIIECVNK